MLNKEIPNLTMGDDVPLGCCAQMAVTLWKSWYTTCSLFAEAQVKDATGKQLGS